MYQYSICHDDAGNFPSRNFTVIAVGIFSITTSEGFIRKKYQSHYKIIRERLQDPQSPSNPSSRFSNRKIDLESHSSTMVFGFGSSSSPSESSTSSSAAPPAPSREERKACWNSRDLYYDCLTSHKIVKAGDEAKGADGKIASDGGKTCKVERDNFNKNCSQSWVSPPIFCPGPNAYMQIDYFNQRRVLEFRQRAQLQKAAEQGVAVPEFKR